MRLSSVDNTQKCLTLFPIERYIEKDMIYILNHDDWTKTRGNIPHIVDPTKMAVSGGGATQKVLNSGYVLGW